MKTLRVFKVMDAHTHTVTTFVIKEVINWYNFQSALKKLVKYGNLNPLKRFKTMSR